MLNLILLAISIVLQIIVVYYGWRLYRILNPVRYWSNAWLLYSLANLAILIRRTLEFFSICFELFTILTIEYLVQVLVSVLLLVFSFNLKKLYTKYFNNGLDIEAWKQEQKSQEEKYSGKLS